MKKLSAIWIVLVLLLLLGGGVAVWSSRQSADGGAGPKAPAAGEKSPARGTARPGASGATAATTPDDRMARADKIRRDYDEMTMKFSADYGAAGNAFPGGLSAYLRQLAMLQFEKHKDLAAILTPRELEDLEMRDTPAGQTAQKLLGDTAATEEQRRAVFRLQKEFEDQFALTFDLTPAALLARETGRQATQQKIRAVLGDDLFGSWLRGEGPDYAGFAGFVQQAGLGASVPLELWRLKSDYLLARLQLKARTDLAPAQINEADRVLTNQVTARVTGLIGPAAVASAAGREVLTWLPLPPVK